MLYVLLIGTFLTLDYKFTYAYAKKALTKENPRPYVGVDVRGFHTSIQSTRYPIAFPSDFYEKSFALISKAGMNHIRYAFYWEALREITNKTLVYSMNIPVNSFSSFIVLITY